MPRIALAVFVVCVLASFPATAQTLAVPFPAAQIAFFDGQRVAVESEAGQAALAELDAFQTEASVELADRNQALLNQRAQLDAQASVLSGSARLSLEQRQERGHARTPAPHRGRAEGAPRTPATARRRVPGGTLPGHLSRRRRHRCAVCLRPYERTGRVGRSRLRSHRSHHRATGRRVVAGPPVRHGHGRRATWVQSEARCRWVQSARHRPGTSRRPRAGTAAPDGPARLTPTRRCSRRARSA